MIVAPNTFLVISHESFAEENNQVIFERDYHVLSIKTIHDLCILNFDFFYFL